MDRVLAFMAATLFFIILFSLLNEKILKKPNEIALLLFSLLIGIILKILGLADIGFIRIVSETMEKFRLDKLLLDVLLCFMLFSGASELKLQKLVHNFKPICLLALLTTIITSAIYGALFWIVIRILGLDVSFILCFMFGAIVSPTDPIAATSILSKLGLSEDVIAVMEGESLFNDGTGVALFIFLRELYLDSKGSNFFLVMGRELLGAIVVGFAFSFIMFWVIKMTKNPILHISVSLMTVALCYLVCEHLGFSGVIASVICGIYFSTQMDIYKVNHQTIDPKDWYKDFWSIVDALLNYALYILIGISFIFVSNIKWAFIVGLAAIVFNVLSRYIGVFLSAWMVRKNPAGYSDKTFSMLMTWGGLKGGLCLALAMSISSFVPTDAYNIMLFATYVVIIWTTLVQGLTIPWFYRHIPDDKKMSEPVPEEFET